MSTVLQWLTLHLTPNLGAVGCKRLLEIFGSPAGVLRADRKELLAVPGVQKRALTLLADNPPYDQAEKEVIRAQRAGVTLLSMEDAMYPELLRSIYAPPIVLYARGTIEALQKPSLAIVGSRAATTYGMKVARSMAQDLGRCDITVTSGMALGIDTAAHQGCLDVSQATIAVLGCGVDVVYPRQNASLYKRIMNSGVVISEYPLGTKPEAFRFPARNRIICGIASGVLVVEAAKKSGSLITARYALDEGRDVFAIPGRVDSFKSAGTHRLLQEGAKLVQSVDDILEEYHIAREPSSREKLNQGGEGKENAARSSVESVLLALLDAYPQDVDSIIRQSGLSAARVNEHLLLLEMQGKIERQANGDYGLRN